ncbi:MAG: peptide chain release factor N(5)-glutamine methyltransferase [Alphaproteobacteria bacterium]|nr:peptide chain release factor N(5)-glutamine methyltransferase [Alphaproteobacteria bacterium]
MRSADALLGAAAARLAGAGVESARLDARLLLAHVLGVAPGSLLAGSSVAVAPEAVSRFDRLVVRREAREPLAYLTGRKGFWSHEFAVGPGVLVPRPETETLIEEAFRLFPDRQTPLRLLDLGTGSGCLLLTLLHAFPNATGTGVEQFEAAFAFARTNRAALGLDDRATLLAAAWQEPALGRFDLVVSNPPYIPVAALDGLAPELHYEPRQALDGGADGLDAYRDLSIRLGAWLVPGGHVLLEIGIGQGEAVSAILAAQGLEMRGIRADLAGIPRCVVARRTG